MGVQPHRYHILRVVYLKAASHAETWAGCAQELDVDTEMQRGMLPGAMALSAKFVPVVQRVSQKTLEAVKDFVADPKALSEKVSGE